MENCFLPVPDSATGSVVATFNCIPSLLQNILNYAARIATIVAVFVIVYAGVKYVTSRGDKTAIESARQTITYGIIGLLLVTFSFVIFGLIASLLGIDFSSITRIVIP